MDTASAFRLAEAASKRGDGFKVFDWDKAARIIKERGAKEASAGLSQDWEWTGGVIFKDGKPYMDDYTYLSSIWATPELNIDGEYIDCWKVQESNGWNSKTKWPESALKILNQD